MSDILLADDHDLLGELARFKLEGTPHTLRVVDDGSAAPASMRQRVPDLSLLDGLMPGLTGPDVLAEMTRDAGLADVPVLMLTARKGEADVLAAFRAGADDCLVKPFLPDELLARIERLLGGQRQAA